MHIIPSFLVDKASYTRQFESSFHCTHWHRFFPLKKAFFESLRLPLAKGSSTSNQAFLLRRKDVTALRCSEPLRYKVGGPSKVFAMLCGMGPPCIRLYNSISTSLKYNFIMKGAFFDNSFRSILLNQVVNKFSTLFRYIWTQCYFKLIKYIVL